MGKAGKDEDSSGKGKPNDEGSGKTKQVGARSYFAMPGDRGH